MAQVCWIVPIEGCCKLLSIFSFDFISCVLSIITVYLFSLIAIWRVEFAKNWTIFLIEKKIWSETGPPLHIPASHFGKQMWLDLRVKWPQLDLKWQGLGRCRLMKWLFVIWKSRRIAKAFERDDWRTSDGATLNDEKIMQTGTLIRRKIFVSDWDDFVMNTLRNFKPVTVV